MTKTRFQALAVLLSAGILVLVLSHLYAANTGTSSTAQVGRYQLFQGTYEALMQDESGSVVGEQDTVIFLLDTATGKVRKYSMMFSKTREPYEGWLSTERSPKE